MFTGIIECIGEVKEITKQGSNIHLIINSAISDQLKIDQSVAHNGVCLTITNIDGDTHSVTMIDETLKKSSLGNIQIGDKINLERSVTLHQRLDGHIVQGHIDTTGECIEIINKDGSYIFSFEVENKFSSLFIEKGSISINGISLTLIDVSENRFSVAIIPYTFEHTVFKYLKKGEHVNIEFDMIGKYVINYLKNLNLST